MSKLDELVKNWLSQGKAREWTEVVELIEKLQEKARQEEREAMKRAVEGIRRDHVRLKVNVGHSKDEYWGCCECYEDEFYNKALEDLLNELNKN